MVSASISTRFLIISDTHNMTSEEAKPSWSDPAAKVDVLLHCGDLTQRGGHCSFQKALDLVARIPATLKLMIAGNHDLELDKEYWSTHLDGDDEPEDHEKAVAIMKGALAIKAGVTYLEEGTHTFNLANGATLTIYASPYTPAFMDWAFAYGTEQDRFNSATATNPIPNFPAIDVMMTHGPPLGLLDLLPNGTRAGCGKLLQALGRARPLLHCFGHIHEGHGAKSVRWNDDKISSKAKFTGDASTVLQPLGVKGEETLVVNAAIQDIKGAFSQDCGAGSREVGGLKEVGWASAGGALARRSSSVVAIQTLAGGGRVH